MMKYLNIMFILLLTGCSNPPTCDVSKLTKDTSEDAIITYCGKPSSINASSYSKQLVYRGNLFDHTYIYVRNGKFSSAQWKE